MPATAAAKLNAGALTQGGTAPWRRRRRTETQWRQWRTRGADPPASPSARVVAAGYSRWCDGTASSQVRHNSQVFTIWINFIIIFFIPLIIILIVCHQRRRRQHQQRRRRIAGCRCHGWHKQQQHGRCGPLCRCPPPLMPGLPANFDMLSPATTARLRRRLLASDECGGRHFHPAVYLPTLNHQ